MIQNKIINNNIFFIINEYIKAMSLFRKNSSVIELTPSNFDSKTQKISHYLLANGTKGMVMFGAHWCGHCKRASPEYEKAANALGSSFPLFYLDCEKYGEFASKTLGINGYPTIKYINKTGKPYKLYDGERSYQGFLMGVCAESAICKK
jgi:thiol-disulfide isomerase/thioredoxin